MSGYDRYVKNTEDDSSRYPNIAHSIKRVGQIYDFAIG